MRRLLFVIATFFLLNQMSRAQNWCPQGATWYAGAWSDLSGYDALAEFKYIKDTVILNKNCKMIQATLSGMDFPDFGILSNTFVPNYCQNYTYEQNNVVFLYNGSSFDTLVDFDATIGDKGLTTSYWGSQKNYTVSDTGHVVINNLALKTVSVVSTDTSYVGGNVQIDTTKTVFIERILWNNIHWRGMFGTDCTNLNPPPTDHGPWTYFCGYKDDYFSTFISNVYVCRLTGVKEVKPDKKILNMFPNPNNGNFTLQLTEPSKISIYNLMGELVYGGYNGQLGNIEMSIESLETGIYYLIVQGRSGVTSGKFAKE